jgi:cobalamin biosynthesis protein CbiG
MIAAGRYAEDAICRKIQEATELRPMNREIDEATQKKWKQFIATIPDDFRYMFTHGSARDAAEAGVKAMQEEADKLLSNPSVRKAYERFILVCELTKEQNQ